VNESDSLQHFAELDRRVVAAVRGIKLLASVSWPASVQAQFLEGWNAGRPQLPNVEYAKFDYSEARAELEAVSSAADPGHPVGDFLRRTADSWRIATE
jgi:hypothetical protein